MRTRTYNRIQTDPGTVEEYLEECRARGLRPATLKIYFYIIRTLDTIGARSYKPDQTTPQRLAEWVIQIRKKYAQPHNHIGVAARFLKWSCWKDTHPEWIDMPYMIPEHLRILRQRTRTKKPPRELPILTPQQVETLIETCQYTTIPKRNRALIALLWDTGFRIGEALSMKTKHIYTGTDQKGKQRWYAYCPESKTQPRKVVLHDSLPILQQYTKERDPDTYLWTDGKGKPLSYHTWKTILNRIIEIARKKDSSIVFPKGCKSHLFRHSRATYLANQGWNEAMLMKRFGWTEPRMAAHYVEQSRIDTGAAFDRMDQETNTHANTSSNTLPVRVPLQTGMKHSPRVMRYCPHCGMPVALSPQLPDISQKTQHVLWIPTS